MRYSTSTGLAILLSVPFAYAAGTVEHTIQKQPKPGHAELLRRRAATDTRDQPLLTNFAGLDGTAYYINVTVGTPGQPFTIQVDTGSSDLWIPSMDAPFCKSRFGCVGGSYDLTKSSTYQLADQKQHLNITYVDGSSFTGSFISESVQFGNTVIEGMQLGLASSGTGSVANVNAGILGLGYSVHEGVAKHRYPNFVESLVHTGAISSRLFSIYLNDLASYGSVLFGGVDTEKYEGDLTTLNLFYSSGVNFTNDFILRLESVTGTQEGGQPQQIFSSSSSNPLKVKPDSGATSWYVPDDLYDSIVKLSGAQVDSVTNVTMLPCNSLPNTTLALTFAGNGTNQATLNVPMSNLFFPAASISNGPYKIDGNQMCRIGVGKTTSYKNQVTEYLMGDSVMRSGYWVYDLDNGQVSVAQAKLGETGTNVVTVEAGAEGLRKAVGISNVNETNVQGKIARPAIVTASMAVKTVGSTVGVPQSTQQTTFLEGSATSLNVSFTTVMLVIFGVVGLMMI